MMTSAAAVPLYPYQKAWFLDKSRFKIGLWGRQTGKTFTSTLEVVDSCFAAEAAGRQENWVILSRSERQAALAMTEGVLKHARAYDMSLEAMGYDFISDDRERSYKALEVKLPGGSWIRALPANADTARGYSANVLLDEFALHQKPREIWAAIFPLISAGHRIIIVSTPRGKSGKFYELMTDESGTWSRHTVDIHRAVAEGLPRNIEELRSGLADEELWRQEFECEWIDGASSWLSHDDISACEDEAAGLKDAYQGGVTVIGNDIARRRDLWVAWVLELIGDVAWTREIKVLENEPFAVQDEVLDELEKRYKPIRIVMDQTGMGEKPVEDAGRRYGWSRVEGVLFSPPRQLDLATELRKRFQDRRIRIPSGDRELRGDLYSIKRMAGPTGAPRLVVHDDGTSGGSHADRFWSCALACGGLAGGARLYDYRPVVPGGDADRVPGDGRDDDHGPGDGWNATAGRARFGRGAY